MSSVVLNFCVPPPQVEICIPNTKRWRSAFVVISCIKAFKDILLTTARNNSNTVVIEMVEYFDDINDRTTLRNLVREKNLQKLEESGGVEGIASSLNSSVVDGINGDIDDVLRRGESFGYNTYQKKPSNYQTFFHLFVWETFKDIPTIPIFLALAAFSLGFGIKKHGLKQGWYDGGSIFVAIFLVISISTIYKFNQSRRRFDKRFKTIMSNNINIQVKRNGKPQQISVSDIVVGDVVCLNIGDQVPADGLFLGAHPLHVDQSIITGESDDVEINDKENPFLISGTKVADGYGEMLVTCVGMNTSLGEILGSKAAHVVNEETSPLGKRLKCLNSVIQIVGSVLALIAAVVFYLKNYQSGQSINVFVEFIAAVISTAVTIPGGLPLAFEVAISYSSNKIMAVKINDRELSACETMNSLTTILCMEKSGNILTQRKMEVTKFWMSCKESLPKESYIYCIPSVVDLLHQAVTLNCSPISMVIPIENAILSWAVLEQNLLTEQVKQSCSVLQVVEEFNPSENRRRGVLVKNNLDNTIHVHWKGTAQQILEMCSHYYDQYGDVRLLQDSSRFEFNQIIETIAANSLQCVGLAHKQILEQQEIPENGLILLGILGIKDPFKEALKICQDYGVNIKIITREDTLRAKEIAIECGLRWSNDHNLNINNNGLVVVEAEEFRNCTEDERMETVDKIVVMGGSSPSDKELMVKYLKRKGHVVAVMTSEGTNDGPALREADIGLLMGIDHQGTNGSSDIIILDDDFSSVVRVLEWAGRVYNNIKKFTQFQLTANLSWLVINFVTAVSTGRVPLTALEILWVNLMINPLGALALATETPTKEKMDKQPLISNIMWRNLLGQALYQILVILALQFKGESLFGLTQEVNGTLVYNTYVLCQVASQFNARRLERRNIFEGIQKNKLLLVIVGTTIALHVVMVEFIFHKYAKIERLDWVQWAASIGIAAASWPIGLLLKFISVPERNHVTSFHFWRD